jgi:hypothetical protein
MSLSGPRGPGAISVLSGTCLDPELNKLTRGPLAKAEALDTAERTFEIRNNDPAARNPLRLRDGLLDRRTRGKLPTLRTGAAFNRAFGGPGALSQRIAL